MNKKSEESSLQPTDRLMTVSQWVKEKSWPPEGGLRHLIFNAETNGFHRVVFRCGRRCLLSERAFYKWLAEQNGKGEELDCGT